jgi:hypothetical protein
MGYSIKLAGECDLVAIRKNDRIFVECKRLYSESKARDRVRDCYKQLEQRLELADKKYKNFGLAWIDPSPAMQKHYFAYAAYSEAGARQAARMDLVYFWKEWISNAYSGNESRIFALVLQMIWLSMIASSQSIVTGFTSFIVPSHANISIFGAIKARRLLNEIMAIEGGDE